MKKIALVIFILLAIFGIIFASMGIAREDYLMMIVGTVALVSASMGISSTLLRWRRL